MKRPPFHPKIRQFLFKATHEVFKIGDFWSCVPAIADRCLCSICGVTESIVKTYYCLWQAVGDNLVFEVEVIDPKDEQRDV